MNVVTGRIATLEQRKPAALILEALEHRLVEIQRLARSCRPEELAEIEDEAHEAIRCVRALREHRQ